MDFNDDPEMKEIIDQIDIQSLEDDLEDTSITEEKEELDEFIENEKQIIKDELKMKYLIGPVSIYHFKSKNNVEFEKDIYIFGDFHVKKRKCPLTQEEIEKAKEEKEAKEVKEEKKVYFDDMINMTLNYNSITGNKVIDFFDESPYLTGGKYEDVLFNIKDSYTCLFPIFETKCYIPYFLHNVIKKIKSNDLVIIKNEALKEYERACPYKNFRYHASDPRIFLSFIDKFFGELFINIDKLTELYFTYGDEINVLNDIYMKELRKDILENVLNIESVISIPKIDIQFKYINQRLKIKIIEYLKQRIKSIRQYFSGSKMNVKLFSKFKLDFGILLTDAYTFGRIFKVKRDYEAKNIIIMNGQTHIDYYLSFFFGSNLFELKHKIVQKDMLVTFKKIMKGEFDKVKTFQCLDVSKIKFPLFIDN